MPSGMTRKAIVAVAMSVLVVGFSGAVAIMPTQTEASVQANDLDIESQSIETDDGVNDIPLTIHGTATWSDLPEEAHRVQVDVGIQNDPDRIDPNNDPTDQFVTSESDNVSGTQGEHTFDVSGSVFDNTDWAAQDFSPDDGEEVTHTLEVVVYVHVLYGGYQNESSVGTPVEVTDSVDITVTNPEDAEPTVTAVVSGSITVEE